MINDGGITFNNPVDVQVAPVAGVCNFFVLKTPDGRFDSLGSGRSSLEETHGNPRGTSEAY